MPNALAVVAHHDDPILWVGGVIERTQPLGWDWTVIAMCVTDQAKQQYFCDCCGALGVTGHYSTFADYMTPAAFSTNQRSAMDTELQRLIKGKSYDLVFTHSRDVHGEYGNAHANHVEVREIVVTQVNGGKLGQGKNSLAYFSYSLIYGYGGKAAAARIDSDFFLPLTYRELLFKCDWCQRAPDAGTNLANLAFPCPNPEAFEGDGLTLPAPFLTK